MWSYSGDPASSDRDQVRFYLQDVDQGRQLLADEEIDFVLAQWDSAFGSPLYSAAVCAEVIAARFAAEVSVSADGVSVDQGTLQARYNDLAASLRDQYHALYGANGPIGASDFGLDNDPTIAALSFGVGFQDNERAGSQDYGDTRGPGHNGQEMPETPGW